jgi:transposase-like protein
VYASTRRNTEAARRFCRRARTATGVTPTEVTTDCAPAYPRILGQLRPAIGHHTERYANNRIEADHAQRKRWLGPMRGIKTITGLRILATGHAVVQNLRRGHCELAIDEPTNRRLAAAFTWQAEPSDSSTSDSQLETPSDRTTQWTRLTTKT